MPSCSRMGKGEDIAVQEQWMIGVVEREDVLRGRSVVVGRVVNGSLESRLVAGGRS